jgi:hypothetical protein
MGKLVSKKLSPLAATTFRFAPPTSGVRCCIVPAPVTKYQRCGCRHRLAKSESLMKTSGAPGALDPYSRFWFLPFSSRASRLA